jgi:beta-lactamase class D
MIRLLLALFTVLALVAPARAETACLLIADAQSGDLVHQEGAGCDEAIGPASSFKFTLALIGYDAGILTDADNPAWPYKSSYAAVRKADKQTVTPAYWMEQSVLWYSRVLVEKLGAERFAASVAALDYGNADVSGDPGANNGMTHAWLNTSLLITPAEQLRFVRRFLVGDLPVSADAISRTAAITPAFDPGGGWTIRGKTGTGYIREPNGKLGKRQFGWFIGWATDGTRTYAFSMLSKDEKPGGTALGPRTRDNLIARWTSLVP